MSIDAKIELRSRCVGCIDTEDMVLVTEAGSKLIATSDPVLWKALSDSRS